MYIVKILVTTLAVLAFVPQSFAQVADDYETAIVGNYCPSLSITMKRGARDSSASGQVTELQKFLSGYYDIDPQELVTGYFGRITQDYVLRFQKEQGLPTFGIVGSMTRTIIAKKCSEITSEGQSINTNQSTRSGIFTTSSSLFPDMNTVTSSSATATIDSNSGLSVTPGGRDSITIFGTARGVSSIGLVIGGPGGDKIYGNPSIPIVNGQYKKIMYNTELNLVPGNYTIYIYNGNILLAQRTMVIAGATLVTYPASTSTTTTSTATYSYINASAGTGGTISPSGSVVMSSTGTQTFTATPNSGYAISSS